MDYDAEDAAEAERRERTHAHWELLRLLYESKIVDKSISASESAMYIKLCEKQGLEKNAPSKSNRSLVGDLPFDN